ncbi:hydroxyphenylacetyl-CoA thioesterase PaaI [Microvirga sp. BSC39]|uniref:hydroxyphenylacetyl-CoA thioesterase PaaI n=1 Tax=Microvirga sp. BSC39 TaxID=1549810 RepID=UPI0004E8CBDA|nr:hydroxyphenylacetyl-CoA thioesterase PaaI [Microvirga sp. BSC39]KFG66995.1 phenylacetic acid degradation protein PaaD [Microvirga sp. BSC39]
MDAPSSAIAAHDIAQACAQAMWAEDQASQGLGMTVERVAPGEAVLSMPVRPDMTNGHGICHGGFIFTLADSAFAFACNTYNQRTVAQQCTVTFLQPGRRGDTLTAHAVERNRSGRSGIYDVTVRNGQDEVVAEFRGHSRTIAGTLLASSADETEPTTK